MTASELAGGGLRLIEADDNLLEDFGSPTNNNRTIIIWIRPCFEGILQVNERSLSL